MLGSIFKVKRELVNPIQENTESDGLTVPHRLQIRLQGRRCGIHLFDSVYIQIRQEKVFGNDHA
jgi:hypothetical protein